MSDPKPLVLQLTNPDGSEAETIVLRLHAINDNNKEDDDDEAR
jgi:hypothetical protein